MEKSLNKIDLIPRIYLETTIFNYYFLRDISRENEISVTKKLFYQMKSGKFEAYSSAIAMGEIEECPDSRLRKKMLNLFNEFSVRQINIADYQGYENLAEKYILAGAIPVRKRGDALHIALATLSGIDILVSWNCDHIVRFKTQQIVRTINITEGLHDIAINTPKEVIIYEEKTGP